MDIACLLVCDDTMLTEVSHELKMWIFERTCIFGEWWATDIR